MNLTTARSAQRAREVGVRKVLGAARRQLMGQFLGEALLLTLVALVLAGGLAELLLPVFNDLSGKTLTLFGTEGAALIAGLVGLTLVVGLGAGSYPALYLSGFQPAAAVKGRAGPEGSRFRSVLVVTQFAITVVLLVGVGVVFQQLDYVQQKDLGFEEDHLVVLSSSSEIERDFEAVRNRLLAHPGVEAVTASRLVPSDQLLDHIDVTAEVGGAMRPFPGLPLLPVDFDFLETYGLEMVAGRSFSQDRASDSTEAFILNEEAVRQLGWSSPDEAIGKRFTMGGRSLQRTGHVVGVVRDFHFESLHERIAPLVLFIMPERTRFVTVKVAGTDLRDTMAFLEATWQPYAPNHPFSSFFIDQKLDQLYTSEQRLGTVIGYFSVLAVFIACLGLLGLASFMAERRTKEIGVRKVLGASVSGMVVLLSSDFLKLVGVAFVPAAPLAYVAAQQWLGVFAYRITLGPGLFLLAGGLTLVVALATVSYHAVRAATADPVKALRYE